MTTTAMETLPKTMTYANLNAFLKEGRVRHDKRNLSTNASIVRLGDTRIAYRLHDTNIAIFYAWGAITLSVGKWVTNVTYEHLNIALSGIGSIITDEKNRWYLQINDTVHLDIRRYRFFNGITVDSLKSTVLTYDAVGLEQIDAEDEKLCKAIEKYVKLYTANNVHDLILDMQGDCWLCSLTVRGTEITLGELQGNQEHLLLHIEESYLQGSLIFNAYRSKYQPDYIVTAIEYSVKSGKLKEIHRLLKKYLKKALLKGATQVN